MSGRQGSITGTAGARLTGVIAVVYGLGFVFLPDSLGGFQRAWLFLGAVLVGILFVVYLLVPFVLRLLRGDSRDL